MPWSPIYIPAGVRKNIRDVIATPSGCIRYVFATPSVNNRRHIADAVQKKMTVKILIWEFGKQSVCIRFALCLQLVCIRFVFVFIGILSAIAIRQ